MEVKNTSYRVSEYKIENDFFQIDLCPNSGSYIREKTGSYLSTNMLYVKLDIFKTKALIETLEKTVEVLEEHYKTT